ncbi:D-2-hydroxyacid dehydrogenase [Adhaeribacter radiodurans]|uniref:D-2-hydroxyacid dehydrogenase n=1 Tax=Adhaeribacter radiodurans TaxID=2745197 RepID=A0A7L7LAQ8_9BACT|nr:D-2-hydroxyacid dehydrogenase [Adhaeribacter radiodurans]QMU29918.1 D-2-hydroxyacid dehydrogenase [Adhaeribacter radiodurans]
MKLFIYTSFNEANRNFLRQAVPSDLTIVFRNELAKEDILPAFQTADIVMGNPPVAWFEEASLNLVFWQLDSAGFEQYQSVKVKATVANMGDFFARPCAETMVGGILAFYRGIPELVKLQEQKKWQGNQVRPHLDLLGNKKVIILGAGTIGQTCKQMLTGFGCQIKMTARQNPAADIFSFEDLLKELPETDVVINTLPGGADKYVSETFIQAMKTGSLYASVGRGSTTDEQALISALQSGKLIGAVLDVTEEEPIPESNPLWEMENVLLTQHTGGGYLGEEEGKVKQLLNNLPRYLQGEEVLFQVNLAKGY